MTVAESLRAWRSYDGCTQAQAADWMGVPLRTYQEWEQGRHVPSQPGPVLKLLELAKSVDHYVAGKVHDRRPSANHPKTVRTKQS